MSARRWLGRLRALGRRSRLDRELDAEIRAHLELAERDARADGLSQEAARRAARRAFGNVDAMRETHRDRRGIRWADTLRRDVRYGLASLRRHPGFAVLTIAILALGIGANAAMFTLVDAVLLKSLPFPDPDRLVAIWQAPRPGVTNATSTLDYLDWTQLNHSFDAMAAEQALSVALTGPEDPVRLAGKAVTADYFKVFGVTAELGRTFGPGDDQPGAERMAVLSHHTWMTTFGADPGILQRQPILDGERYRVIGVLAPGAFDRDTAAFWIPLVFTPEQRVRDWHWLTVYGRLQAGITLDRAQADMNRVNAVLATTASAFKKDWTIVVRPFDGVLIGTDLRRSIAVAFGAVLMVLLIACANVTNLLLAKGAARGRELAVRAALGASRGRLVVQLLTESMVLAVLGGAAGLAIAALLLRLAKPILTDTLPYTATVGLDTRMLVFTAMIALGVALVVGVLPAWRASLGRLTEAMSQSSRGSSAAGQRTRRAIVVAEIALSLVLVCGALLLFKSLLNLQRVDTGVRIDRILTTSVTLPERTYPTTAQAALFYEQLVQEVEAAPGVAGAALGSHLPLRWIGNGEAVFVRGVEQGINVRFKRVDAGYFDTFDVPILAGRGLTAGDRAGAPRVAIVNQTLAKQLAQVSGRPSPIGQLVRVGTPAYLATSAEMQNVEIIGVIRSERVTGPGRTEPAVLYAPLAQAPAAQVHLIVRTRADPARVTAAIRAAVKRADPNLPLGEFATMAEVRDQTLAGYSRPAWVIGAFASLAALLAALGLYGVLAHAVTQQRREIGIRMALGARAGDVLARVFASAIRLTAIGLAIGLAGTYALTRVMTSLLFQVSPLDPAAVITACAVMTVIGVLACAIPASRAARVDPIRVLRNDG